jgi:hypothetical protein
VTVSADLETKAASGQPLDRVDAGRLLAEPDLVSVGMLGEAARQARTGNAITWVRVSVVAGALPAERGDAGEVRLVGKPASADEARRRTRDAVSFAADATLTGFSLADLLALAGGDHQTLSDLATALVADGLQAIGAVALDEFTDAEQAAEAVRAVQRGGLAAPRATLTRAPAASRLDLIERAAVLQEATQAFRAFSPLPDDDPADEPSTGYDDVRTIVLARLCTAIPAIQVSWPLYGPKLAQVAIAYGASDIDAVSPVDTLHLGHRRSPREDIERQIRAAFAEPVERDGRFERLS